MSRAQELIDYQRKSRNPRAIGAGDIRDAALLTELLTVVLDEHLERTAPVGEPEHTVSAPDGYRIIPAQPPPPWQPENADQTGVQLASLLGHLQDATRKTAA